MDRRQCQDRGPCPPPRFGGQGKALVGGIPLIRFKSEERLQEILDYCAEIGVFIANPPTYYL